MFRFALSPRSQLYRIHYFLFTKQYLRGFIEVLFWNRLLNVVVGELSRWATIVGRLEWATAAIDDASTANP